MVAMESATNRERGILASRPTFREKARTNPHGTFLILFDVSPSSNMRLAGFATMQTVLELSGYPGEVPNLRESEREAISDYLHESMQVPVRDCIHYFKAGRIRSRSSSEGPCVCSTDLPCFWTMNQEIDRSVMDNTRWYPNRVPAYF
jgi:hypothetical protein